MKRRIFLTLIPALAACFALAGAERTAQRPTEPQPAELRGRVTADGRGVEGVAVTDGRTIVRTDAKGRYRLASASDAEFVYLTIHNLQLSCSSNINPPWLSVNLHVS